MISGVLNVFRLPFRVHSPHFSTLFSRKLACKNCINKLFANRRSRGLYENEIGELIYSLTLPASSQWDSAPLYPKSSSCHQPSPYNSPRLLSFLSYLQIQAVIVVSSLPNYQYLWCYFAIVLSQLLRKTC